MSSLTHRRLSTTAALVLIAAVVAVITAAIFPLAHVAPVISLGVLYLLGVLAVAVLAGWQFGLLAAIASALAFNFFHIEPTGRLTIAESENWVALGVFLVTAVVAGTLADTARFRALEAEERRAEAEEAAEQLRIAARERDALLAETVETEALRRSDVLKTALLRSVSHDLRSPLTAILASADALGSSSLSAQDRKELSAAVSGEAQRLSALIDKLLDLSKLEADEAEPKIEAMSVEEVLLAATDGLHLAPGAFSLAIDRDLPEVDADAAQLERAFANLLENAVHHSGGEPVSVRAREVNGRLVVRVVDRGSGIAPELQERIFEPFYRAPSENGDHRGSGLGLAIARGFIDANGGKVWAESLPGQGTAFVVEFPLRGGFRSRAEGPRERPPST